MVAGWRGAWIGRPLGAAFMIVASSDQIVAVSGHDHEIGLAGRGGQVRSEARALRWSQESHLTHGGKVVVAHGGPLAAQKAQYTGIRPDHMLRVARVLPELRRSGVRS
jgi:hypothetical protein